MTAPSPTQPAPSPQAQDRLARLAARSADHRRELTGRPVGDDRSQQPLASRPVSGEGLPSQPPSARNWPSQAIAPGGTLPPLPPAPTSANATAATAPRRKRPHAARGSRRAALLLSLTTTLGLAAMFKMLGTNDAATNLDVGGSATSTNASAAPATTATTGSTGVTSVTSAASSGTATTATATTAATTATSRSTTAPSTTGPSTTAATTSTGLQDGTFTGATATNRWGPVQVQITVSGGKITAVDVLQVPDGNNKDVVINNRAVPVLVSSTLRAQSAKIDSVSGATYTSVSYKQSLQSAIDTSKAAAGS